MGMDVVISFGPRSGDQLLNFFFFLHYKYNFNILAHVIRKDYISCVYKNNVILGLYSYDS